MSRNLYIFTFRFPSSVSLLCNRCFFSTSIFYPSFCLNIPYNNNLKNNNFSLFLSKRYKKWLPFHAQKKTKKPSPPPTLISAFLLDKTEEEEKKKQEEKDLLTSTSVINEDDVEPTFVTPYQAINLIKSLHFTVDKEDEDGKKVMDNKAINLLLKLNVDLTRESIRGSCQLPHGLSEDIRLLVFCKDEQADEMISYGANYAGLRNLIDRISKGWIGFDKCIASPDVMNQIVKIAKILGPLKLMPNLKSKTITMNLKETILAFKSGGLIEYRAELNDGDEVGGEDHSRIKKIGGRGEESVGYIRVQAGKIMQSNQQILENISFFVKEILKSRKKAGGGVSSEISAEFKWPPRRKKNRLDTSTGDEAEGSKSSTSSSDFILGGKLLVENCAPFHMHVHSILPNSVGYFR